MGQSKKRTIFESPLQNSSNRNTLSIAGNLYWSRYSSKREGWFIARKVKRTCSGREWTQQQSCVQDLIPHFSTHYAPCSQTYIAGVGPRRATGDQSAKQGKRKKYFYLPPLDSPPQDSILWDSYMHNVAGDRIGA